MQTTQNVTAVDPTTLKKGQLTSTERLFGEGWKTRETGLSLEEAGVRATHFNVEFPFPWRGNVAVITDTDKGYVMAVCRTSEGGFEVRKWRAKKVKRV